ncbi:MAG: TetR/AcrR family transcriptional regulator [Verrucomicrobiales bacterium]
MPAGRPIEFDIDATLELAMEFFWARGYRSGGINDLVAYTGVGRQSLYNTFGNKRELFIRVIHHYRNTRLSNALALLARSGSQLQNVRDAVGFFEKLALDKSARGCLIANALVEIGHDDPEISGLLGETLALLENGFRNALASAQKSGELSPRKNPRALARALTNASIGMAVTSRLKKGRAEIADIYAGTLAMLT